MVKVKRVSVEYEVEDSWSIHILASFLMTASIFAGYSCSRQFTVNENTQSTCQFPLVRVGYSHKIWTYSQNSSFFNVNLTHEILNFRNFSSKLKTKLKKTTFL